MKDHTSGRGRWGAGCRGGGSPAAAVEKKKIRTQDRIGRGRRPERCGGWNENIFLCVHIVFFPDAASVVASGRVKDHVCSVAGPL